jgi:cellulose synthase/poly-beta-1,6-N-acetylglucosamine synthase-like glycosyltransferase
MADLWSPMLMTFAGLAAIPVSLFCVEVLAAVFNRQRGFLFSARCDFRQCVAVLVPAHNEGLGLLHTLENIKTQLRAGDRIVVVADNCSDNTAAVAKAAGAEVTERNDLSKIGKGYALEWGIQHLSINPPGIVVIVDADCKLTPNTLDQLSMACSTTNHPVQALNLMTAPNDALIDYRVAVFAFRVKNWVRPLGLSALHLPCQLMGTGMAFPWKVISSANLATGLVVEDLKLGLDLTRAKNPPLFCPSAGVISQFPSSITGARSQRKRWEQGHLAFITRTIPRLVYESFTLGNFHLLALALDAAIPPLTLLGMMVFLMVAISGFSALLGLSSAALFLSAASLLAYLVAILLCWLKFARDILPLRSVFSIAAYAIDKLPLYLQMLSRSGNSQWIRTDRKKLDDSNK